MRLNIFHFQYCFGFHCLDLVILWENMKVMKDNVSSKLSKFESQNFFGSLFSLFCRFLRESGSKLLYLDISK